MQNPALNKLIQACGGSSKFGASLGLKHNTISGWKTQGCIPAWRAQQISQVLRLPIEQILPLTRRAPKKWTKRKQLEPAT